MEHNAKLGVFRGSLMETELRCTELRCEEGHKPASGRKQSAASTQNASLYKCAMAIA